jgi:arabinogalactan endo-1,4-beta-galactosidase
MIIFLLNWEKLKQLHFEEINSTQKQKLQTQIESVIAQLTNGSKQFDFNIYFSEVMQTKGGFDIVIAIRLM